MINDAVGLIVLLLALWLGLERRRFRGPPIGRQIAQRQAEIVQVEEAVARE